jgi:hypothetical protein
MRFGATVSVMDDDLGGQRSYGSMAHPEREFTDSEIVQFALHLQAPPRRAAPAPQHHRGPSSRRCDSSRKVNGLSRSPSSSA